MFEICWMKTAINQSIFNQYECEYVNANAIVASKLKWISFFQQFSKVKEKRNRRSIEKKNEEEEEKEEEKKKQKKRKRKKEYSLN